MRTHACKGTANFVCEHSLPAGWKPGEVEELPLVCAVRRGGGENEPVCGMSVDFAGGLAMPFEVEKNAEDLGCG